MRIEADRADPRKLWSSVNVLLVHGSSPHSSAISAEDFCRSFADTVAKIRAATADADAPSYSSIRTGISLQAFSPFSVNDVADSICRLPDKCSADPIPTYVLRRISYQIAPFITSLFNRSLTSGQFPVSSKVASVTPVPKKPVLDPTDAGSYRPISNLYAVQIVGTHDSMPTACLLVICRPTSATSIWLSSRSFHRDRRVARLVGHSVVCRPWGFRRSGPFGPVGGIRHHRL